MVAPSNARTAKFWACRGTDGSLPLMPVSGGRCTLYADISERHEADTLDLKIKNPNRTPTHIPAPTPKNTSDWVDSRQPYLKEMATH